MKKKLLLVASVALILGVAGCSNQPAPSSSLSEEPVSSSEPISSSETPVSSTTEEPKPSSSSEVPPAPSSSSSEAPVVEKFTVTFDSAGGTEIDPVEVIKGELVEEPEEPIRAGKSFVGWFKDGITEWNFETDRVTKDITLVAKWALSVDPVLEQQIQPYAFEEDSALTVWTNKTFKAHNKDATDAGWGPEGNSIKMSWRTIFVFDADGCLCYGVWCPANGFGGPASYTYASHHKYSSDQLGFTENPAIKLGAEFATNSKDFEIVIPEGGFAITGYGPEDGTAVMVSALTGGEWETLGEGYDHSADFNATHAEWSNRTFRYNELTQTIEVYVLSTSLVSKGDAGALAEIIVPVTDDLLAGGDGKGTTTYNNSKKDVNAKTYDPYLIDKDNYKHLVEVGYLAESDIAD